MKLENIGFYTLSDYRTKQLSFNSPLWRCELILTNRCNFKCPYCRGLKEEYQSDLSLFDAIKIIDYWASQNLKNIRFSGGEPTLWKYDLPGLIRYVKCKGIERIAISTNGSTDFSVYYNLYNAGVNDFSISLDACCSSTGKIMNGGLNNKWEKVIDNIKRLSELTYVTVGIVLTENNIKETLEIIKLADKFVDDIRIIPSAQYNKMNNDVILIDNNILKRNPILKYRVNNIKLGKNIRGITKKDCNKCFLVLDDMAIVGNHHYPCIIYLREQGKPIGEFNENVREQRVNWFKEHDSFKDDICRKNCLDVCVDYNNKAKKYAKRIIRLW